MPTSGASGMQLDRSPTQRIFIIRSINQIYTCFGRRSTRRSWILWMGNCNRLRNPVAMQKTDLRTQTGIIPSRVLWLLFGLIVPESIHRVLLYHHQHRHSTWVSMRQRMITQMHPKNSYHSILDQPISLPRIGLWPREWNRWHYCDNWNFVQLPSR